ncbi:MAG: hypothetical protein LBO71_06130 [Prevotellaceae bacterium]|jgi:hypothetical protein|nr:hypothetical protein [Prevotellaceae bacterium]
MKKMLARKVSELCATGALIFASMLLTFGAQAATYYVTPTGSGDGKSWGSATANIQRAIDSCAANGGGEVWVKAGTYKPAATIQWKDSVNVYGGFAGNENNRNQRSLDASLTVLDGDGARLVLQGNKNFTTKITWSGFTVQNGKSNYYGGIYMYRNMVVDNFIIKNCINQGSGNYGGGGVYIQALDDSNDSIIIRNSKIVGNTANYGGGIAIGTSNNSSNPITSHVLIENTEIINNKATARGGGIAIEPKVGSTKNVVIRSCIIANNSSGNVGGGISLYRADAQIINTTIANNVAGNWGGGGIYANSVDSLTVLNSIFWNNEDAQNGTGSHNILLQGKGADSVVVIRNSAFAPALQVGVDVQNNTALTVADTITVDTLNSGSVAGVKYINFGAPSAAAGYAAGDAGRLNASWSLAQGSAAIDKGTAVAGITADIVGRSRPTGGSFDIGAYEYAAPITIAAGATVSTGYTADHGDVIFEADTLAGAGQWTATTAVTNGAVKLVRTFKTNTSYAIGFPFAVASVSAAAYELKYYDGESNLFGTAAGIEAGKGYLIRFPAPKDTLLTVAFTSVHNPTPTTAPTLGAGEYALVANATLQNAAGIAGAQNYYVFNSATGAFAAPATALAGGLMPFDAVLATSATADLLTADTIGKGNAATPSVILKADSGITVLTPKGIAYPYLTVDPFVATFSVAPGYTNIRAIVSAVNGATEPDTIPLTPSGSIYTAAINSVTTPTIIRLAADTIRSTLTISVGEGIGEVSLKSGAKVGYFDGNTWFTFKTRDGYHTPKVAVGNAYKEVRKGAGGVDTVFLGGVTSNVTVNIVAFRNNTAPVLYDLQVVNAAAPSIVVDTASNIQLRKQPAANQPYAYLKFDVADAVKGSNYDKITLRLLTTGTGQIQNKIEYLLQWVSNNSNGGNENTDGATPWNNNFTYAGRPVIIEDTVSIISIGTGPGIVAANTLVEFTIDDPTIIAQIKSYIAGGSKQLSFRINPNATTSSLISMLTFFSSEGSTGDILNRTPKLTFNAAEYNIAVVNEARESGLITLTAPSAADTTYKVKHDSALVLSFTVKKGYEPKAQGYGELAGAPSITSDATYTFRIDKARASDTIRLSADLIRFDVDVQTPNGHVTIIRPAGSSPYKVANDSAFALSFRVDAEYIPTVTVSSNPAYALGDTAPDGSYTVSLPKVSSDVTITVAADLPDSVTVRVQAHDSVTIVSPALTDGACKVARDSALTLTFTVAEGYDISAVKVNGAAHDYAAGSGEYTLTIPQLTASILVSVEAEIRKYKVVLTPVGVSIVTPEGANPHLVSHGGSLTVSVTVSAGYFEPVVLVRLDGSTIATAKSGSAFTATISGVAASDSIVVKADDGIRRITIRKDARVALTASTANSTDTVQQAQIGGAFSVTFTVPTGYEPKVSLQDGGSITTLSAGAANTYTSRIGVVSADAVIAIELVAATGIAEVDPNDPVVSATYYNLLGQELRQPTIVGIYIVRKLHLSGRITVEKKLAGLNFEFLSFGF